MDQVNSVYDVDPHFIIDPVTRNISSKSGKKILMQFDHNSERFTFEIPRYIDGYDVSMCNMVEVHYVNTDSENTEIKTADVYTITDLRISPDSEDVVLGSWLVSQNATKYNGTLTFGLRFAFVTESSELDYQWFTNICSLISVAKGIYNAEVITNNGNTDLLNSWKTELFYSVEPYVYAYVNKGSALVEEANRKLQEAERTLSEYEKMILNLSFGVDFDTGCLIYEGNNYNFVINPETGNLEWELAA